MVQKQTVRENPSTQNFFIPAKNRDSVDCIIRVPKNLSPNSDVIVAIHGISRSPLQQIAMFTDMAEKRNAVIIAPFFDKKRWGGYQKLFCRRESQRADLALIKTLPNIYAQLGIKEQKILLYGYSGGAQFAHRFAFLHPEQVHVVALGAAGWYTFPDLSIPFPLGLKKSDEYDDKMALNIASIANTNYFVAVADNDVALDKSLNQEDDVTRLQGKNRVERAINWTNAMQDYIKNSGANGKIQLSILKGGSHSFRQCMFNPDYVNSLENFFFT